ncbi:MAG: flagellar biosynthesis protein FlhA [Betaproteobacteria bacterium]|jgi:flagellar biosynthesis protein FlhA|nr:flagellar biosynthesis protein FlhA [Rhodocyclaceae bacterium]MCA3135956.1 flagellar biosynthesis protein FlhA [Rhodocyclaceae bacterium]MCA3141654.1 flagellar biosynthesis protein FlhA [Rhodocyclaceae bacterium]MCA3145328.1 flagellar biosynthesis protein FlhA [Rhodocyclaceae bacterium]MCE2896798.1 flagellar biosynthesis protein FlhA [Betaproteobacteria bacterium]
MAESVTGAPARLMSATTLAGPVLIILVLGMMTLPLPTILLDLLFTFNIAVSMIVLLVALFARRPLDFSVFPTVLLVTTLLRLSLNVASTRIVLLEGHTGPGAAGKVIEAFGSFLIGGNYAVGVVVFVILVVINFVVITKGAGRIAEVSARFTLDAMPGKQMAIDADLNAGLIGEEEARKRRTVIAQEADFYGSMDGASKFVRGDAIAGIVITIINILAGLVIGMSQHGLGFAAAAETYTLLTIGDGLVAQIPSLIISTAAGIVVSRVATDEDLSQQLVAQLFTRPQALYVTASILALLGLIPGMPHLAFLLMSAALAGAGFMTERGVRQPEVQPPPAPPAPESADIGWQDVPGVDMLGLEVGFRLVPLVDRNQDGDLLRRIRGIRKKIAQEMGFLVPAVHIRDNLELKPNGYRITLKGVEIGAGDVLVGQFLAINPGRALGPVAGSATRDPAFGLPAVWVSAENREQAISLGYTVVDAATVIATHLSSVIQAHAAELLGRQEVQALLDHASKESPKLVEELVPKLLPVTVVQKVLGNLLAEGVHVRDVRTILETLAEHATRTQEPDELTAAVRLALSRAIIASILPGSGELQVIALDSELERVLMQASQARGPEGAGLEPNLAENLLKQAAKLVQDQESIGQPSVLMVPAPLRTLLSRFLRRASPQLKVLSHAEVPDGRSIRVVAVLGGRA